MITDGNTTVIGPVGSEIRVGVPPNRDATRPIITAPQRPAAAPAPEAMPKANAMGKAITAAVSPPNTSPFRFVALMRFSTIRPSVKACDLRRLLSEAESWEKTTSL